MSCPRTLGDGAARGAGCARQDWTHWPHSWLPTPMDAPAPAPPAMMAARTRSLQEQLTAGREEMRDRARSGSADGC